MEEKRFLRVNAKCVTFFLMIMILVVSVNFALAANTIEEFYPLHQGNTWTYTIREEENSKSGEVTLGISGEEIVSGTNTVKLYSEDDKYEYLAFDSEGVKKYKTVNIEDKNYIIFSPPVIEIPNIEVGGSVNYSTNCVNNTFDNEKIGEFKANVQIKFISVEDVMVPAGKFSDCLKFSLNVDWANAESHGKENRIFWLARGVGKIKEISIETEGVKGGELKIETETRVLISAVIDGKKIGGR